ncbi:LuxR family transcriptional regulator [Mycobacterium sp. shizuoka-1]|uniref:helix-turn-helix transcriptional regulator n=1 Tax=Mycobacterium sp. shizuoka-1 TaxID=2039281 RepID=UPI000C061738|nr:LuxR family transcriptional regulator [Mycobacterium sp. shizuoka-1]GAY14506.1 helix-turn-helix transcriptional regulator [Mycobacterium sp. shizuoka-1]
MSRGALIGRQAEQQQLVELCDRARAGHSGVLVVDGEAGIGKTALLADLVATVDGGLRVIRISGAESEMELAYAGVAQLCRPILAHIDRLPDPQKNALRAALGLRDDAAPDRLLVSLAVLTLLGDAGAERPTVCIIDDAQWVDRASLQALTFTARRLLADPVLMIFATRTELAPHELTGLPDLHLTRLAHAHASTLLADVIPGQLDEAVRENILAEADGNPLALLELRHSMAPAALAGGYGLTAATSVTRRIDREYDQRLDGLPPATRSLLLVAAAEPTGEPTWLWAAAARLGLGADVGVPAEHSGLITIGSRLRFRHPLVRSAVYRNASPSQRRHVHAVLADVVAGPGAEEHRAWHRAHATSAPDETVAVELVQSAERARRRGGVAAAAAFLANAVELTPDPARRAERALDAALLKLDAGDLESATRLLGTARGVGDELLSARMDLLRAKIAFAAQRGRDAPPLLLAAAEKLGPLDPLLARRTYLDALTAAMIVGRLSTDKQASAAAIATAARQAPPPPGPATAADLFLDGIVCRLTEGHGAAAPLLQRAISEYLKEDEAGVADPRSHDLTLRVLLDLFDQDTYDTLNARQVELLRAAGELTVLPAALTTYAGACVTSGDFAQAANLLEQSEAISTATGAPPHRSIQTYLAACRGDEEQAEQLAQATIADATARGEGSEITVVLFSLAILHNGLGQHDKALTACASALEYDDVGMYGHLLNEMVEAAARSGQSSIAETAAANLIERAEATGTPTARGYAARARALTAGGGDAEHDYRVAIAELARSPLKVMTARTHLLLGEWLRRANRRAQARDELRIAHGMFRDMGADGLAERALRELQAAGESVRNERIDRAATALTTQESYIARLAGDGYSNSEIASHLFISPRTVEWHLSNIFAKLGVSSRRELRRPREPR